MFKALLIAKWGSLKSQLQYPVDFFVHVLGISFIGILEIFSLFLLTNAYGTIGGWTFWEIGFITAVWRLAHSVHHLFFIPFWWQGRMVKSGEFDRMLIRPLHPIFQIMAQGHCLPALGEFIPACALLLMTAGKVAVPWNFLNIAALLIAVFSGSVIEWSVGLNHYKCSGS